MRIVLYTTSIRFGVPGAAPEDHCRLEHGKHKLDRDL